MPWSRKRTMAFVRRMKALAETLRRLHRSPGSLAALAERARANVHRDFPLGRMVDGLEAAIRFAADRRDRA